MRRAAAVIACASGLALGGCGGDPERGAEETVDAWIAAVDAGDYARACELSVWPEDSPGSCEDLLRERSSAERRGSTGAASGIGATRAKPAADRAA